MVVFSRILNNVAWFRISLFCLKGGRIGSNFIVIHFLEYISLSFVLSVRRRLWHESLKNLAKHFPSSWLKKSHVLCHYFLGKESKDHSSTGNYHEQTSFVRWVTQIGLISWDLFILFKVRKVIKIVICVITTSLIQFHNDQQSPRIITFTANVMQLLLLNALYNNKSRQASPLNKIRVFYQHLIFSWWIGNKG